ncbi:TSL-kinase interacting protein [Ranunculus cassubicifolius]
MESRYPAHGSHSHRIKVVGKRKRVRKRNGTVKKQTRQWAAWTRQEEESFFNALRQVGKNFQMITSRVKSKNKDQVRHYYYRLVRRMNKLLGPDFSLDAKNSKDTNAAMLRWWSLLEKHSCKASKLHLKPRRFKMFIETLEHQLLRDRKKNVRRRASQKENCSSSSPATVSFQGKDTPAVKGVLVNSQNIQRVASGKGSSQKRGVNNGTNRSNNKVDLSTVKVTRQRRKTGNTSSAAYKRWEKAAIAGVSLVADAAEHLERTTMDKEVVLDPSTSEAEKARDGQKVTDSFGNRLPLPTSSSHHQVTETTVKLKLQLFPIDEATRIALEKEEHNPHLELTLTARKKITSVVEHLSRKWGKSSIASGELILFPYSAQRDNLVGYQRWTLGTLATAADVYASLGSPHIFRLRYGWFSAAEVNYGSVYTSHNVMEPCRTRDPSPEWENVRASSIGPLSPGDWADSLTNISIGELLTEASRMEAPVAESVGYLQQNPFSCDDSFDAAIAAHIASAARPEVSHVPSSIWDAEETCDAFSFRKFTATNSSSSMPAATTTFGSFVEELPEKRWDSIASNKSDDSGKALGVLTDSYWPSSLGALDMDTPLSSRYQGGNQDVIFGDSVSLTTGLNRLLATSLDAFQSCTFLGLDKAGSEGHHHDAAPLLDCKIGEV